MLETRETNVAVEKSQLVGIAVPYNEWAEINGPVKFREQFEPGSINVPDSVVLQYGHEPGPIPLARVGAGTMTFRESSEGLVFSAELPDSATDVREALERGDLDGSVSIGFYDVTDSKKASPRSSVTYWRTVTAATLDHLAIVKTPAYSSAVGNLK